MFVDHDEFDRVARETRFPHLFRKRIEGAEGFAYGRVLADDRGLTAFVGTPRLNKDVTHADRFFLRRVAVGREPAFAIRRLTPSKSAGCLFLSGISGG